ncbi:hypothetical protein RI054_32g127930 [Pseudoscourfieldia marina]
MGKKGKKGPVMPPGMTEEYFMCTQDTLGCSLVLSGIGSTPSKAPMPVHFTKGQAAQFLWQNALVDKAKLDEAISTQSVQAAVKCIQVSPLLNEKTLAAGLLECLCLEEKWRDFILTQCKPSCIPALISCLNAGSAAAEVSAFRALRALCETEEVRPMVCKQLNAMADSWNQIMICLRDCLEATAKIEGFLLIYLCTTTDSHSRANLAKMRLTFDVTLDIIRSGKWNEAVRGMAMRVLRRLLMYGPSKEEILSRGGLETAVTFVKACSVQDSLFDFEARCAGANVLWALIEDRTLPYGMPKSRDSEDSKITQPSQAMTERAKKCIEWGAAEPLIILCCGPEPSSKLKEPPPPPGKKKKKGGGGKKKKGGAMPPGGEECMQYAVGSLRAMTLWEEGRDEVINAVDGYGCRAIVLLAESKTDQTRWHATATLLNLAAHGTRVGKLEAAGAPPYITNLPPNRVFEGVSPTSKPRPPTSMGDIPRPGTAGPDAP